MVKLVNLTPHALSIITGHVEADDIGNAEVVVDLPPSGSLARVQEIRTPADPVITAAVAIPTTRVTYGNLTGLPDPVEGTVYVVSGMVLAALGDSRPDVMAPGPLVRDEATGQPIGCQGLTR